MTRKSASTTSKHSKSSQNSKGTKASSGHIYTLLSILGVLVLWELIAAVGIVPSYMLPTPGETLQAFIHDFGLLMSHTKVTLLETLIGTLMGVSIGYATAILMDMWDPAYKFVYPLVVLSQTIPAVAIAPLLVLWFGYKMMPKVILIILITFFPIVVGVLDGFRSADKDAINLLKSMGANKWQIFCHIKFPSALPNFFSGLRITVAYAVVGAVLAEWLGGFAGLGVYMTRVKKSFAYDKMFAVIILISIISLVLIWLVNVLQKKCMPWERIGESNE